MKNNPWNYFKAFYVLSIQNSPRIPVVSRALKRAGIRNFEIVEYFSANKIVNNGGDNNSLFNIFMHNGSDETSENIVNNHFSLIQKAYDKNLENIVIFEDDAEFEIPFDKDDLKNAFSWLSSNDWDIFYFGYCQWPFLWSSFKTPNVISVSSPLGAHGYALSRKGMKKILTARAHCVNMQIDKFLASLSIEKYALYPSICFQSKDPAIYTEGLKRLKLEDKISFKTTSKLFENISLFIPVFTICIIVYIIYKI